MAKLYTTDGKSTDVQPGNGRSFTLEEMQALVGGYIQILYMADRTCLVFNEDGKRLQMPRNPEATKLVVGRIHILDYIVGPALHCTRKEVR